MRCFSESAACSSLGNDKFTPLGDPGVQRRLAQMAEKGDQEVLTCRREALKDQPLVESGFAAGYDNSRGGAGRVSRTVIRTGDVAH